MKFKFTFLTIVFFVNLFIFSQNGYNYHEELNKITKTPLSPETKAFSKFGSTTVNLFEGKPNIEFPIYYYEGLELDIPIILSYDMDMRKVQDLASNVGLGWNLNVGGRITRKINGLPDDYLEATGPSGGQYKTIFNDVNTRNKFLEYKSFFSNHTLIYPAIEFQNIDKAKSYFKFLNDVEKGEIDFSVDSYIVSASGINEYIYLNGENGLLPIPLKNGRNKVDYSVSYYNAYSKYISEWIVTDDSGNQFFFGDMEDLLYSEQTLTQNFLDITPNPVYNFSTKYNSAWLLKKIVSQNGSDVYEFEYEEMGFWNDPISSNSVNVINTGYDNQNNVKIDNINKYKINQKKLVRIKHNNNIVADFKYKNRLDSDIPNSALESITIKNPIDGTLVKYIKFDYSYFGQISGNFPDNNPLYAYKLKLDRINFAGRGFDNTLPDYDFKNIISFLYENPLDYPNRLSFAQDELGFFNGISDNDPDYDDGNMISEGYLYPKVVLENGDNDITYYGADRTFVEEKAKIGLLNEIEYPTGNKTRIEYETHQTKDTIYQDSYENFINHLRVEATCYRGCDSIIGADCNYNQKIKFIKQMFGVSTPNKYKIHINKNGQYNKAYVLGPFADNICPHSFNDVCSGNVNSDLVYEYNNVNEKILFLEKGNYFIFIAVDSPPNSINFTEINIQRKGKLINENTVSDILVSNTEGTETQCPTGSCCANEFSNYPDIDEVYIGNEVFQINDFNTYKIDFTVSGEFNIFPQSDLIFKATIVGPFSSNDNLDLLTYEQVCSENFTYPKIIIGGSNSVWSDFNNIRCNLDPGYYKCFVINTSPYYNGDSQVSLQIIEPQFDNDFQNITINDLEYPGFRIASIKEIDNDGSLIFKKQYSYDNLHENYKPILYYFNDLSYLESGNINTTFQLNRLSNAIVGDGPYITYGRVTAKTIGFKNGFQFDNNGEIIHIYRNDPDMKNGNYPQMFPPFITDFYYNSLAGSESDSYVLDNSNKVIKQNNNLMMASGTTNYKGVSLNNNLINNVKFIQLYYKNGNSTDPVKFRFIQGKLDSDGSIIPDNSLCQSGGIECLTQNANAVNFPNFSNYFTKNILSVSSIEKTIYENLSISNTFQSVYSPAKGYLLSESTSSTSENNMLTKKKYYYPSDFPGEPYMNDLIQANNISSPVMIESYAVSDSIETINGKVKTYYTKIDNKILPSMIKSSKDLFELETKMMIQYDVSGFPIEINNGVDQSPSTYIIWGYNKSLKIAEIENFKIPQANAIQALINDAIEASNNDDDTTIGNIGAEGNLRNKLNNIRNHPSLKNTSMISYTYDPMIGVTSKTDSQGFTVYYKYNGENELEYIIDNVGNVVSKTEMNYKQE